MFTSRQMSAAISWLEKFHTLVLVTLGVAYEAYQLFRLLLSLTYQRAGRDPGLLISV